MTWIAFIPAGVAVARTCWRWRSLYSDMRNNDDRHTFHQHRDTPRPLHRPLVKPPDGTNKRVPYRRVTTFVKALEDTYAIDQWGKRLVAYGMGQRHDLQLAASALSLDDSHKKKLQRVADDALEVAQG